MTDELVELLQRIDRNVAAMLAIAVDRHIRETDLATPRPRSIDRLLVDVGLSQAEVGTLLGKSRQAVSQVLANERKSNKSRASKS